MANEERPNGWGEDNLTQFLETSFDNDQASYELAPEVQRLKEIVALFVSGREALGANQVVAGFYLMAYSSLLGAIRLAMSGQLAESHTLLRGCLERALYALHAFKNPELARIWLQRNEGEEQKKLVRKDFTWSKVLQTLGDADKGLADVVARLYEESIDHGAHPNPYAYLSSIDSKREGRKVTVTLNVLNPGGAAHGFALKTCSRVGIAVLHVLRLAFEQEFSELGVPDRIRQISEGL